MQGASSETGRASSAPVFYFLRKQRDAVVGGDDPYASDGRFLLEEMSLRGASSETGPLRSVF